MVDTKFKKGHIPWSKGKKRIHLSSKTEFKKGQAPWNKNKTGVYSEESRRKMSISAKTSMNKHGFKKGHKTNLGRPCSEETKRKIGIANKGKLHSEEFKIKNRLAHLGKSLSEEHKKKISDALKGKIPKNINSIKGWNRGIPMNEETKRKLLLSNLGRHPSEETRKKLSEAHKGKHPSEETIRKIREANKGKPSWNKGRHIPEELKKRIGLKNREHQLKKLFEGKHKGFKKGHKLSEESKRKKSESMKGITPWNKNKIGIYSEETKRKMREGIKKAWSTTEKREYSRKRILQQYASGQFPHQENTKPERQIKEELLKRGYKEEIDFIHQYKFMNKFMCDFCFPKQKIVVEVYGDFWHANPKKYPVGSNLHKHQIKDINKDKAKEAYITKVDNNSWTYLVLWENDIKKDAIKCVDIIEEVLKKKK